MQEMPVQRQGLGSSSFQSEKAEAASSTADLRESKERPSEESEREGVGLRRKKKRKKEREKSCMVLMMKRRRFGWRERKRDYRVESGECRVQTRGAKVEEKRDWVVGDLIGKRERERERET